MADKTTGELDAVKERAIGDLPPVFDIYYDTNIPVEQQGEAMRMSGKQFADFGKAVVKEYVQGAVEASESAKKSAEESAKSAEQAANSASAAAGSAAQAGGSAAAAGESAKAAEKSKTDAAAEAKRAESFAHGGTDTREGEDTDNAQYYAGQAKDSAESTAKDVQLIKENQDALTAFRENLDDILAAAAYAVAAVNAALRAQSWADGGTNTRDGEDVDNARYYFEQVKRISQGLSGMMIPMGTITFEQLSLATKHPGYMYNIRNAFVTDDTFAEGAGYSYPAGTNVYYTAESTWDCLAGTLVTGVKGAKEKQYRIGNIDLSAENIGARPDTWTPTAAEVGALGKTETAAAANKLATARKISLISDVTGSADFDGSQNIEIAATLSDTDVAAGTYGPSLSKSLYPGSTFSVPRVTVDKKGRVTGIDNTIMEMPVSAECGSGFAICTTPAGTYQKTASMNKYRLLEGGIVSVLFISGAEIGSQLNINNTGSINILTGEGFRTASILPGETVTFVYTGGNYRIIAIYPRISGDGQFYELASLDSVATLSTSGVTGGTEVTLAYPMYCFKELFIIAQGSFSSTSNKFQMIGTLPCGVSLTTGVAISVANLAYSGGQAILYCVLDNNEGTTLRIGKAVNSYHIDSAVIYGVR